MAGGSAGRKAQEARRKERELREQWQSAARQAQRWEAASEGERRVAAQLLVLTGQGWRLLVDRRWPGTRSGNVDMLLVGPGGVFVVDVKNWSAQPRIVQGRLTSHGISRDAELDKLLAMTRTAEGKVSALGLTPVAVRPMMVFVGQSIDTQIGRVRLLGEREVASALQREQKRLGGPAVRALGDHLEECFPAYEGSRVDPTPAVSTSRAAPARPGADDGRVPAEGDESQGEPFHSPEPEGLFDLDGLREASLESIRKAPIERWMTFLHPNQAGLVRRRWSGPARISGPAGTGKTVVGLHRAAHLAQRTGKRVLYVTFANNIPRVQHTFLRTMVDSALAERVEFSSLHSWAQGFLRARGITTRLEYSKVRTAFSNAWRHVGRRGCLIDIDPNSHYWQDEIDRVIKSRGVSSFEEYAALRRRGRLAPLRRVHREAVWELYLDYQARLNRQGLHDFNDVLSLALAEARAHPEESPYGAVVVDEVQDVSMIGVQLLHALVGDAPDGLLVIGDGQQTVYPGGYRLSDAGVDIRGSRAQVLRVNYRNAEQIYEAALEVVADETFEDIDGMRMPGRRDVDLTYHDGQVVRSASPSVDEHDRALLEALRHAANGASDDAQHGGREHEEAALGNAESTGSQPGWGDHAVLCFTNDAVDHYRGLLERSGIPTHSLKRYDGHPVAAVKVGTYQRAKGLEFKHVYLPRYDTVLEDIPAPVHRTGPSNDPAHSTRAPDADAGAEAERERGELVRNQLFVAMTRARDSLWLGSVRAGPTR